MIESGETSVIVTTVPLEEITAVGVIYAALASLRGSVAGRVVGHRPLAAAWVLRNGPALALNLAGGGSVVIGMPHAERAAGLVAGLAGANDPGSPPALSSPWPTDALDAATYDQAAALVKQRKKAAAAKLVCARTHMSVGDARHVIEAIAAMSG